MKTKSILAFLFVLNIFISMGTVSTNISSSSIKELITLFEEYITGSSSNSKETFLSKIKLQKKLTDDTDGCWLKAIGRGVGKPIHTCRDDEEQSGLLCYPRCKEDYTGAGPVCWQNCQENFRDDGAYCFKTPAYGRGAGYTLGHEQKCLDENPQGCEKYGLLLYPKCKEGYHNFGCCICSPTCEKNMDDIGVSCHKNSYGRGVGRPLTCDNDQDYDTGLCYKKCENGFKGIGPVCWDSCPEGYNPCGALCLKGETCSDQLKQYFEGVISIITAFAQKNYPEGIIDIAKFVDDFIYPICKK